MKLSQLFSGEVRPDHTAQPAQPTPAQAEQAARQIRSLVPGQTISGEIVSRNGSEVQIRVSDEILLTARVDRNMNIEVGKNMTFEVKNNGSTLTLSPLFTNVSADVNVLKALDMAGLPVNSVSVEMTEQLMAAGMSVNRSSLQQIFREINAFPQGEISDIISLHRLQIPVNQASLDQMVSYRNLNHQLTEGMNAVLEALPETYDAMAAEGDIPGAVRLFQEVLRLAGEEASVPGSVTAAEGEILSDIPFGDAGQPGETTGEPGAVQGERLGENRMPGQPEADMPASDSEILRAVFRDMETGFLPGRTSPGEGKLPEIPTGTEPGRAESAGSGIVETFFGENAASSSIPEALRAAVGGDALELLAGVGLPEGETSALRAQILQFVRGEADAPAFISVLGTLAEGAKFNPESMKNLEKMFSGTKFRTFLSAQLKNSWMLRPEEVGSPGKVEEMYNRLDRQLRALGQALENAGQTGGAAHRAVASMTQNIDFLQQVNQLYTYVQLPLRMQQGDTHGDLYVYANRKRAVSQDGSVSALLHLDMEHLGPVDVYVALKSSRVSTKFYLRDDAMIEFMAAHMDVLTSRLQKRGYECSFSMVRREESGGQATEGGLQPVLGQESGMLLSHYSFDVRT